MTFRSGCGAFAAAALLLTAVSDVAADEGMWLFTNPPTQRLKDRYGFEPDAKWLEHVQKASVRFNSGGSGSFVSPDGLVMTNHHVGVDALQKMSSKEKDYVKDGFAAKSHSEEVKCLDLELNVLMSVEPVTARVNGAVQAGADSEEAAKARKKVIAEIEKESTDKTGLRSDVVTLYQGGEYHLYRYKKYTDVRLVFAPEKQIAFYGGDPDNFEYPRYDLDICFFRAYENDRPAKPEHSLTWSKAGCKDGELTFVSGHPGHTDRLNVVAELEFLRDVVFPRQLARLNRLEVLLTAWGARSEENSRRSKDALFSVQNSRKARLGGLAGLMDPTIMAKKVADEAKLKLAIGEKPELKDAAGAWDKISGVVAKQRELGVEYGLLEGGSAFNTQLFGIAKNLVRAADERPKPSGERLKEFGEARLESLQFQLFSKKPIYEDFETLKLADSLTYLAEQLGGGHPVVKTVLAGKAPRDRAAELVQGTKLRDVDARKKLWDGGKSAVDASNDPMVLLVKSIDEHARGLRKQIEPLGEIEEQAYAQIAKAKYVVEGPNNYPDATFTLRLAYGPVKGYEEDGKAVPGLTDFAGLYKRAEEHKDQPPFDLPPRWLERKSRLDLKTPFNFVSTADIIGGNSGSPVINKAGELVGIIFDGNIQSLVLDFAFEAVQARAVSVHSAGIIEALRKVYDADKLADELTGSKK